MIYEGEMGIIGNSEKNESDEKKKKKNGSKTVEKHEKKRKNIDSEKREHKG